MHRLTQRGKILRRIKVPLIILAVLLVVVVTVPLFRKNSALHQLLTTQDRIIDLLLTETNISPEPNSDPERADRWRQAFAPESEIFSAYLDTRPEVVLRANRTGDDVTWAEIRIVGVMPPDAEKEEVDCIYKYRENGMVGIRRKRAASVTPMKTVNWMETRKNRAYFILCNVDVPESLKYSNDYLTGGLVPISVSIAWRILAYDWTEPSYFVDVRYDENSNLLHRKDRWTENSLAVCIPVSHSYYDEPLRLIEFLEYYKLLSVEHFTFYNYTISPEVSKVLQYYMNFGDVTVVPWHPLYVEVKEKIIVDKNARETNAVLAALNDCLYRNSFYNKYKYIAVVNTNEFIVPKVHYTLDDLITYLESSRQEKNGEFLFSSALFFTDSENAGTGEVTDLPFLYTQAKTRRTSLHNTVKLSERYIARGMDVVQLGETGVREFLKPSLFTESNKSYVGRNIALLHRYESCKPNCQTTETVIDKTAHRYVQELTYRVRRVYKTLFGKGTLPGSK